MGIPRKAWCWMVFLVFSAAIPDRGQSPLATARKAADVIQELLERVDATFDGTTWNPGLQDELNAALRRTRSSGDRSLEAAVRTRLGRLLLIDPVTGEAHIRRALEISLDLGDQRTEAAALFALGELKLNRRLPRKGLDPLARSAEIFHRLRDPRGQAGALDLLSKAQEPLGLYEEALANLIRAREVRPPNLPFLQEVAESLRLGRLSYILGRYREAAQHLEASLPGLRALRQRADPHAYEHYLEAIRPLVEDFKSGRVGEQALTAMDQPPAVTVVPEPTDPDLARLRQMVWEDLQKEEAERFGLRAASLAGSPPLIQWPWMEGFLRGQFRKTQEAVKRIGQVNADAIAALPCEVEIYDFLGRIYALDGSAERAAEEYRQAWDIVEATDLRLIQLWFPTDEESSASGPRYDLVRELGAARALRLPAPPQLGKSCGIQGDGWQDLWWGDLFSAAGRDERALEAYRLASAKEVDQSRPLALSGIAAIYQRQGKKQEALDAYRQAIDATEEILGEIRLDQLVSSFAGRQAPLYTRAIELAVDLNQPDRAFEFAERARARAFLNQIGNRRIDLQGVPPNLIAEWQTARQRLEDARARRRVRPSGTNAEHEAVEDARAEEEASRAYEGVLDRLKRASPEYASLISVQVAGREEVQRLLPAKTTLIEFFVLDRRTLAWVIDRETMDLVELPVAAGDLQNKVKTLRDQLAGRREDDLGVLELYAALLGPLEPFLRHENLVVVPHGPLHYLPFAALRKPSGRFLIEDHTLSLAPSASVLRFVAQGKPAAGGALVLGNPDGSLPEAGEEAEAVAALYGAPVYRGIAASEALVRREAGRAGVLHLAAHGVYDPVHPLFSRVDLAPGGGQDGRLEVHEIFNLDLSTTRVVVLSACDTALGERSEGDDIVSLSRALLAAGAPAAISTLWRIDDRATAALMVALHRRLRQGEPAATALRAAQLEILARPEWRLPFFWAAFMLTGLDRARDEGLGNGTSERELDRPSPLHAELFPRSPVRAKRAQKKRMAPGVTSVSQVDQEPEAQVCHGEDIEFRSALAK